MGVRKGSTHFANGNGLGGNDTHFYKLKERGAGVKEIITSTWASKEDLSEGRESGSGSGSGSAGRRATVSWSEDDIPLKSIRVKNEVEVDTRSDTGGALSPV